MGCASSSDASTAPVPNADRTTSNNTNQASPFTDIAAGRQHRDSLTNASNVLATPGASATGEDENPLAMDVGMPPSRRQQRFHSDPMLDSAAFTENRGALQAHRKLPRHRSHTVVCGVKLGYETPEPPIEEHLARIERRAAIAPIHGITANVNQFRPDPVSAGELARCREVCREWLSSIASL